MDSFVEPGSLCSVVLVALFAVGLGKHLTEGQPKIRRLGTLLGAVTFLAVLGLALRHGTRLEELGGFALAAAALAATVLGVSWLVLAVLRGFFIDFLGALVPRRRTPVFPVPSPRQEAEDRCRRDELQREAARRCDAQRAEELQAREARKRRAAARAACAALYQRYAPEVAPRFSKEQFDAFVEKYLHEELPVEAVEAMGVELQAIIRAHLDKAEPAKAKRNLTGLLTAFDEQRLGLLASALDEVTKCALLLELDKRRDELICKVIQELQP